MKKKIINESRVVIDFFDKSGAGNMGVSKPLDTPPVPELCWNIGRKMIVVIILVYFVLFYKFSAISCNLHILVSRPCL